MDVMAKLVRIMWVPVIMAMLYTGWIFWQRHRPAPPDPTEPDPMAAYGKSVKILQFYGPPEIAPGGTALVCYGVVNATEVRLAPAVEPVWPAVSRCFHVTPAKTTRYTLTAEGPDHATVSQSIEITVKR